MPPKPSMKYKKLSFIVQNLFVRYPRNMGETIRETSNICLNCRNCISSSIASYCQICGECIKSKTNSFLDNSSIGKNNWWIWIVFTVIFIVVWQVIGSLPLVGFCGLLKIGTVAGYSCSLDELVITGASKAPNFLLMHITFVIGAASFYFFLKILHNKNLLKVLTERIRFDYKRSLFALSIFFLFAVIPLTATLLTNSSELKLRGDIPDLLLIALIALIFVPIQASLEEAFFRGYLLQGFSLLFKSRVLILIITSSIFACLHLMNPEPWSYGVGTYLISVFLVGMFMGLITLIDGGIELAVGIHIANNLWVHLIVGLEDSVIPSSSLFITTNQNLDMVPTIISSMSQYALLTVVFAFRYKWFSKLKKYPTL